MGHADQSFGRSRYVWALSLPTPNLTSFQLCRADYTWYILQEVLNPFQNVCIHTDYLSSTRPEVIQNFKESVIETR
jgi:hypothetical protein